MTAAGPDGQQNITTVEWISHLQFSPPLISVSLVDGFHSSGLVQPSGGFGLCFASESQRLTASAVGTVSGSNVNKFTEVPSLATEPGTKIAAPVRNSGEFCIRNEEICIKNEELCIENDEFCRCFSGGVMSVECNHIVPSHCGVQGSGDSEARQQHTFCGRSNICEGVGPDAAGISQGRNFQVGLRRED